MHDALEGFAQLEEDRRSLQVLQTRKIISWLVNIQLKPADRIDEAAIWPLPLDEELKQKRIAENDTATVTLGKTE